MFVKISVLFIISTSISFFSFILNVDSPVSLVETATTVHSAGGSLYAMGNSKNSSVGFSICFKIPLF